MIFKMRKVEDIQQKKTVKQILFEEGIRCTIGSFAKGAGTTANAIHGLVSRGKLTRMYDYIDAYKAEMVKQAIKDLGLDYDDFECFIDCELSELFGEDNKDEFNRLVREYNEFTSTYVAGL